MALGDNVVFDIGGSTIVTKATRVRSSWLTSHARIANGKTVLDVNGDERTLPRASLSRLARGV